MLKRERLNERERDRRSPPSAITPAAGRSQHPHPHPTSLHCYYYRERVRERERERETEIERGRERVTSGERGRGGVEWLSAAVTPSSIETKKYSDQMESNRRKQVVKSRGGSWSIVNHIFKMTNQETQMPHSPLEIYLKLHFNAEKGWLNDQASIQHGAILDHIKEAKEKLVSEGTTINIAIEHAIEKEAIRSVCAKEKTIKSAWAAGVRPVFRKKDQWMTSEPQSSQPRSSETEELWNHVVQLTEELKQNKEELKQNKEKLQLGDEKYNKMLMFMRSKFSDFDSTVSTPVSDRVNGLDEQLSDRDNFEAI